MTYKSNCRISLHLDLTHNIDVIDDPLNHKVQRTSEWHRFRQLRQYLKTNCAPDQKAAFVRMLECEHSYSFEYQGNASKLVQPPLTDKCYLTLMHGMHLRYGGTPYGPASTGKTESVKALGACLARQVLVFNCDEGIDFQAMGRIFINLVWCRAWRCFDEFNRLLEEQMAISRSSVDQSCDQDPRKDCLLAWPGDHWEPQCGYLHYHESSHERLRWATEVAGQSEAAIQACSDKPTRQ